MLISNYITEEKVDIIFERLTTYIDKNLKSFICKDSIIDIKNTLMDSLKDPSKLDRFFEEGINFHTRGVLFIEAISIFDFLRKNFIAHLPNGIDLRHAKRVERIFEDIIRIFSRGYLTSYCKELIDELGFFIQNLKKREFNETLLHSLNYHFEYFNSFLEHFLEGKEFVNRKYTECDFGKWLKENGKTIIEDDLLYSKIKMLHKNFHNLIDISFDYDKNKLFRELFFVIKEVEANSLWLSNEISYINTKILSFEFSKDFLTGLLTRRALDKIFNKYLEITELTGQPISVIISDIDFFKKINDTYGHLAGDMALKHFSNIIKENLRKSDYIFRIGGEEFVILLPNTSLSEAAKLAENLRTKLLQSDFEYEGNRIKLTASFGVAEFREHENLNNLLKEADEKLYKAKEQGRNRVIA